VNATGGLRFQPAQRLRRPAEFQQVYAQGRKFGNEYFSAAVHANQIAHPRLGLSIAARTVGNAVQRNRVKRVVRDSFRRQQGKLPAADIVIGARMAARTAAKAQLHIGLQQLWDRIITACASC
jgi:ribonuclease P protein component